MTDNTINNTAEDFGQLFQQSVENISSFENHIVKGIIVALDNYYATVDVGLKSEGKILLSEFKNSEGEMPNFTIGSEVEVYIERYEDNDGNIVLSREKARREEVWYELEKKMVDGSPVTGSITKRIKGGFAVVVDGLLSFLPGSQLDARSIKNINGLVGKDDLFQIIKMDKERFNIIVSKKALAGKSVNEQGELVSTENYKEGQIVEGVVKNLTGYGAFIDLGSVDGLLHVTDISWSRINHISEVLQLGETIKLVITKINPDNNRISLGLKQLSQDPWKEVVEKYKVGEVFTLKITNTADYGVFVGLADGIEGLVHISELSWTKKDISPKKDYTIGDEITVKVIEIDDSKRKTNLSVKQCISNPWADFIKQNPEGSVVEATVKIIQDNGLIVTIGENLTSLIKLSDLSWEGKDKALLENYAVGDVVSAKVIRGELERDRIVLGIKQLTEDKTATAYEGFKKGDVVNGKVIGHTEYDLEVELKEGVVGLVKKMDIALEKNEQSLDTYPIGSDVQAVITNVNSSNKYIALSIKLFESQERKKHLSSADEESTFSLAEAFNLANSKKEQEDN